MTITLGGSVGLLDQALAYTCARLSGIRTDQLDRRTPCAGWDLASLLAHMDDALDAFTEAAGGAVAVHDSGAGGPMAATRAKAQALRAVWARPAPGDVVLESSWGRRDLHTPVLVVAAALEVTVHGWDVSQTTGEATPVPDPLAAELLPVAWSLVRESDRGVRFAPARPVAPGASAQARLLAFLGRGRPAFRAA